MMKILEIMVSSLRYYIIFIYPKFSVKVGISTLGSLGCIMSSSISGLGLVLIAQCYVVTSLVILLNVSIFFIMIFGQFKR